MKIQCSCLIVVLVLLSGRLAAVEAFDGALQEKAFGVYSQLPLSFEANAGQVDPGVRFIGRGQGLTLFLTDDEAVLSLRGPERETAVVRMHPVGGVPRRPSGSAPLPMRSNYFLGNDPKRWQVDVPNYAQVRYESVYPGIDLVYRGNPRQLEYDFVIATGADPGQIRLAFQGAPVTIGPGGELILHTVGGDLVQRAPVLYQTAGQERERVEGQYVLLNDRGEVGFAVGRYDRARALVIDPIIVYSTFLGGSETDVGTSIAVDGSGNVYLAGLTSSASFPVTAFSFQGNLKSNPDGFVTKINSAGTAIVYSTFLGGDSFDSINAIAVDDDGNAYVTGTTSSPDFPGVSDTSIQKSYRGNQDGFVTKIDATGAAIRYSTYLGGDGFDESRSIALDGARSAYVTGVTSSTSFPGVTPGSLQPTQGGGPVDAFVTKINPAGTKIDYSTFLGGDGSDQGLAIAVDGSHNVYITGSTGSRSFRGVTPHSLKSAGDGGDAFVTKINPTGDAFVYSTFLGGPASDSGSAIAVDRMENAYITGETFSGTFLGVTLNSLQPANRGNQDAFVTKINSDGSAILYSTFLGGPGPDIPPSDPGKEQLACCVAVDSRGNAYIAIHTNSTTFPGVGPGSIQPFNAGSFDIVVTQIDPTGTRALYSTFLGGPADDSPSGMALDGTGNVYIVGTSRSPTFPGINAGSIQAANAGRDDVILTKISPLDFIPTRAGSCAVLTACRQPGTYPCCTSEPTCTCRHEITDDADCTAGGKTATGCSITVK